MNRTRLAIGGACVVVVACAIRFALQHWDSVYDDAFIYLRYVRNLDHGCGLRFNCAGDPVEGFTSPLFLGLLWLGSLVTDQLIWWCQALGTLCLAGAAICAILVAAKLSDAGSRGAIVVVVAVASVLGLDDFALLNTVIGLETSLAALAFGVLALAVLSERPWLVAGAAFAFVLARPEGAVFVFALPLLPWMRRRGPLLALAGVIAAMTAVRYAVFGELLPNTFYAKSGGTMRHLELGLAYLADVITDFPILLLAPLAAIALVGRARTAALFLLAGTAAWVAFFLRSGGDTFSYSRLMFPLVPVLTALALAGFHAWIAGRSGERRAHAGVAAIALAITVRAAVAHHIPEQHAHPRVVEWSQTWTWLRTHLPHGSLVATVPIGAIGYYSSLPILDLVGLTEPAIARAGRSPPSELLTKQWIAHERNNTEYVLSRAPAMIATTMVRDTPWTSLDDAKAGFYADWLLLQEIKAGRAPYRVRDAEVAPGRHVLMFERITAPASR